MPMGGMHVQSITAIGTTISCYVGFVASYIAMAMVVVGHICTQNIMVVHN